MSELVPSIKQSEQDNPEEGASRSLPEEGNAAQPELTPSPAPVQERRSWPRRKRTLQILIQDAAGEEQPIPAWVMDRSLGGLRLAIDQPIEEGTILRVRRTTAPADIPWVEVQVKRLERKENAWELGCQFTRSLPWDLIMQFG